MRKKSNGFSSVLQRRSWCLFWNFFFDYVLKSRRFCCKFVVFEEILYFFGQILPTELRIALDWFYMHNSVTDWASLSKKSSSFISATAKIFCVKNQTVSAPFFKGVVDGCFETFFWFNAQFLVKRMVKKKKKSTRSTLKCLKMA